MKRINSALLLATVASMALTSGAFAQSAIPAPGPNDGEAFLHGVGASAVQNVLVQELNCIGGYQPLGVSNPADPAPATTRGTLNFLSEPTNLPTGFNCATTEVQPNFEGRYVATGSGFGRQFWRLLGVGANQFQNASGGTAGVVNPFASSNPVTSGTPPVGWTNPAGNAWTRVQFAFSEAPATSSDLTAYTTNGGPAIGGALIQIPKYVLPVALAYNPVYGRQGTTDYRFRVNSAFSSATTAINGVNVGGLRLSRDLYCKVFNGVINNFNHGDFTTANGGTSLRDTADSSTRWDTVGVPIRLVGRLDRSGTTDIFTRALASQCNGIAGVTNKFAQAAETLPYDGTTDFTSVRSDTGLNPSFPHPRAGTINAVSNSYFNGGIQVIGGGASTVGNGLFLVADGSSRVRDAINFGPDANGGSGVLLNGKLGYIAGDFIANSPTGSSTLFAAALQVGSTSNWALPSAAAGTNAMGSVAPPTGANRADPLAWVPSLGNPSAGYPITGTSQFLGYTCYTPANRRSIYQLLASNMGQISQDSTGASVSPNMFIGTSPAGLLALSNIGAVPATWRTAITNTFLSNGTSGQTLYIQNGFAGGANPSCSGRPGA